MDNTEQCFGNCTRDDFFKSVICLMTTSHAKKIAIIADTVKEKEELRAEFLELFDTVPSWMIPPVEYRNKQCLILRHGFSVYFINSADSLKGMTFDSVLFSEEVTGKEFYEYLSHVDKSYMYVDVNAKQTD